MPSRIRIASSNSIPRTPQGARGISYGRVSNQLVVGIPAAVAAAPVLSGTLVQVSSFDPMTLAAVVALLVAVCLAAAMPSALRAMNVEPAVALRHEG
jgi:hypothetical protein